MLPKPQSEYSLYLAASDGSNQRPLIEDGRVLKMSHGSTPVWSVNGEQAAFVVDDHATEWLYVISAAGSNLHRLSPIAFESPIIWSPDNRYLAFIAIDTHTYALYLADTTAHHVQRLTAIEIGSAHEPRHAMMAWSADSRSIVYVHASEEASAPLIYRMYLHNHRQELLVNDEADFEMIYDLVCGPL